MSGTGTFEWRNAGTFGSVFLITPEVQDKLDGEYGAPRVKIRQCVKVVISHRKIAPVIRKIDCIMHFDPWNTTDGCQNVWKSSYSEQNRWLSALAGFRQSGVPDWYLGRITRKLEGSGGEAEPISMNEVKIHYSNIRRTSSTIERSYRVQKRQIMPSRQPAPGHLPHRTSPPVWGPGQLVQHLPRNTTTARPHRHTASASVPIRRQEAILVRRPPFTWYPQVHSTSAAVSQRLKQVQLPPSSSPPDHSQGRHLSARPAATYKQMPNSPGAPSSRSALVRSSMGPASALQHPEIGSSAFRSHAQPPFSNTQVHDMSNGTAREPQPLVMRPVPVQPVSPLNAQRLSGSRPMRTSQVPLQGLSASLPINERSCTLPSYTQEARIPRVQSSPGPHFLKDQKRN